MSDQKGAAPKIMVAEDSPDARHLLGFVLTERGYRVVSAADGREAVELARRECPDLILIDVNMPGVDGLTAVRSLRGDEGACSGVPIIAMTGFDTQGTKLAASEAGCNAYVCKPIDIDRLLEMVDSLLPG